MQAIANRRPRRESVQMSDKVDLDTYESRRRASLWLHIFCGVAAGLALISQENPSLRVMLMARKGRGLYAALLALPVVMPYLLAFLASSELPDANIKLRARYYGVLIVSTILLAGILLTQHLSFGSILFLGIGEVVVCVSALPAFGQR